MDKCTYHDNVHTYREFVKQCMFNVVVFKYHYFSSHVFRIQKMFLEYRKLIKLHWMHALLFRAWFHKTTVRFIIGTYLKSVIRYDVWHSLDLKLHKTFLKVRNLSYTSCLHILIFSISNY